MKLVPVLVGSFVVAAVCLSACGSEGTAPSEDGGDTPTLDGASGSDAARGDASNPGDGAPARDAAADTAVADTGAADASKPPPPGKGQCYLDAQCGLGKTCVATAPGGFCQGCTGDTCDVADADQCNFGTCNASCRDDDGCPFGLRCNGTGTCVLKACSGPAGCDATHTCDGGFCRRIRCTGGAACPAGTQCRATPSGELCVESYLTYP